MKGRRKDRSGKVGRVAGMAKACGGFTEFAVRVQPEPRLPPYATPLHLLPAGAPWEWQHKALCEAVGERRAAAHHWNAWRSSKKHDEAKIKAIYMTLATFYSSTMKRSWVSKGGAGLSLALLFFSAQWCLPNYPEVTRKVSVSGDLPQCAHAELWKQLNYFVCPLISVCQCQQVATKDGPPL